MPGSTQQLTLDDGRVVDLFLGGDPDGHPLVMHHGTPSDSTTFADWDVPCRERSLRLICASRPGYATSTRRPGRTVADAAADTAALLDALDLDAFVTAGWSGGGPHALACAALLPTRCMAVATLAGVGPFGAADLDFLAGMGPENVAEFGAALAGEAPLREWMAQNAEPYRHVTGEEVADAFGGLVPEIDRAQLVGGYAEHLAAEFRRALAGGFDGWIDDDLAFTADWGFDVGAITAPVDIWQGDLDLMVPFAHGRWLVENIPSATARMAAGHGHISLLTDHRGAILDDLAARAG